MKWKLPPGEMLVSGETETTRHRTLQADVLNLIWDSVPDCKETLVVYTKLISHSAAGWKEDWYLLSCGSLYAARIDSV